MSSHAQLLVSELNHAADRLTLLDTELARILHLHCDDISDSVQLEMRLDYDQELQQVLKRFLYFVRLLEKQFAGKEHLIPGWFRQSHQALGISPYHAIIEQRQLEDVINLLQMDE